jgi:hypothetical protein
VPRLRRFSGFALPLLAPLAVVLGLRYGFDPVAAEARAALIHRDGGFAGSASCVDCHADRHASWERTFHRTMTQLPLGDAVLGVFDGVKVAWDGGFARPWTRDGKLYVDVVPEARPARIAEVALLVGSRRYQQVFERVRREGGFAFVRLPIVWSVPEARWLPLHAVFLEPDATDALRHAADWNANCIFCHNTGPEPRLRNEIADVPAGRGAFASKTAELGIACEACHGPGAEHAAAMRDPFARRAAAGGAAHPRMVDPTRLPPDRSVAVCAQCHGQRLPEPLERAGEWIRSGPTFRPGDDLAAHVRLIARDTPPPAGDDPELFSRRFWGDGTPRLTAYEAQGLLASPCHASGGLRCVDCHAMHEGDPRGQLKPGSEGDRACAACHAPERYGVRAHTGHSEGGPGASCVACHMPRIVYGVLDLHRSHRIEVPDPRRDGEAGRPHACTLCHLDRSLAWSAAELTRLHGKPFAAPLRRGDGASRDAADGYASLLAGDPVVRAVYARAAADAPPAAAFLSDASGAIAAGESFEFTRRLVLGATLGDGYPAVRLLARRAALALPEGSATAFRRAVLAFDPLAPEASRRAAALHVLDRLRSDAALRFDELFPRGAPPPFGFDADGRPAFDVLSALLSLQDGRAISIGE